MIKYYKSNTPSEVNLSYCNNQSICKVYKGSDLVWNFIKKSAQAVIQTMQYFSFEYPNFNMISNFYFYKDIPDTKNQFYLYNIGNSQYNGGIFINGTTTWITSESDVLILPNDCNNMFRNQREMIMNISNYPFNYEYVDNMSNMYLNCRLITGSPICGNNVIDMSGTYYYCYSLTGSPVCGENVVDMSGAYYECHNLSGEPAYSKYVVNMSCTYFNCKNIYGNLYLYHNNENKSYYSVNMYQCFYNRDNSKMLNIYVKENSAFNNYLYNYTKINNGSTITWTTITNGYYNAGINTYVYYNL